jgi:hypothetical protein
MDVEILAPDEASNEVVAELQRGGNTHNHTL